MTNAFQQVADDDGLLLYTDWASPSMYTTLQNQFQLLLAGRTDAGRHGEGRPGRLGEVRQDAPLSRNAWSMTDRADAARPDTEGPGAPRQAPPRERRRPGDPRNIGWLYVLPGLAFYVLFTLAPLLHTVYYSLFSWDGLTEKTWVGLANYQRGAPRHVLRDAFVHSAILIVFYAVLPVIIGLLLTAALTRSAIRGFRFFRTTLFLPQLIAGVVIAQAWTWIYASEGPLNRAPRARRARLAGAPVAGRLHLGAAVDRRDRHLGDVRALHGALHRGRAEDPDVALRRGPGRRRRARCASSSR